MLIKMMVAEDVHNGRNFWWWFWWRKKFQLQEEKVVLHQEEKVQAVVAEATEIQLPREGGRWKKPAPREGGALAEEVQSLEEKVL
jgi:hypothetical protein